MSKLIGRLLAVLALGWVGSSSAGPIVTVDGRDWLQPTAVSFDYDTISQACSTSTGSCSGFLGATDLSGYTWANVDDVNDLFNYYLRGSFLGPGPDSLTIYSSPGPNFAWAAFFRDFSPEFMSHGFTSLRGNVRVFSVTADVWMNSGTTGGINYNQSMRTNASRLPPPNAVSGGWFFKDLAPPIDAPIPATTLLTGLGLVALGYTRRRRTPQE